MKATKRPADRLQQPEQPVAKQADPQQVEQQRERERSERPCPLP
jgi:hypothetical protein